MTKVRVKHWLGWGFTTTTTLRIDENGVGIIDDEALEVFRCGQCHALALALHELTGWPIKGIGDPEEDDSDSPAHCLVWCPRLKEYIDIGGVFDRRDRAFRCWRILNRNVSKRQANNFRHYLKPNVKVARAFARAVLIQLGID